MIKRQQGSSQRNKQKPKPKSSASSITDKSLFKDPLAPLNQNDDTKDSLTSGVSTSASLLPSSGPSSAQLHQRNRGLEDIDQDDVHQYEKENEMRNQRRTTNQNPNGKSNKQSPATTITPAASTTTTIKETLSRMASLSNWVNNTREQEATDLWSWATSSRVISQEQRQQEDQDDAFGLARHQLDLQTQFAITLGETHAKEQQQKGKEKNADGADAEDDASTEREKERAKTMWDSSRRAAAFDLNAQDWVVLSALTVATLGARFWRISWPDEVILDETNVGQLVNGYTKGEFVLDAHPPLGKMILAGISSLSDYNGSFAFEDIGDQYLGWVPYVSMRATMALMGALCAPMAYITLKASGHGALAAILAITLVGFDNALTANNRMMALDAPLMFFTAGTVMSWNLFIKQSARPFTGFWWTWLLATGVSMAGAMSVKLIGVVSALTTLYFMSHNLWTLARDKSVNPTRQPNYRTSPRAESDLDRLSHLYHHSLISHYPSEDHIQTWRDVVYGSVVQIQSEFKAYAGGVGNVYLHTSAETIPGGTRQQLVSGYSYPDINTNWLIIKAEIDYPGEPEEIPSRLELVKNGDLVRLRHVSTRKCLHSHNHRPYTSQQNKYLNEVSGYGSHGFDGDSNDWWIVEIVDAESLREGTDAERKEPIKALETTFRLKHYEIGCVLFASDSSLPEPWGEGRSEIACRNEARVTDKSVWRISNNRHDYLPAESPKTGYPTPTYWAKLKETHQLMWSYQSPLEENLQISSSTPRQWPLGQAMILAWSGYQRQMAVVANPVVWWTSAMGLLGYMLAMAVFAVRQKRGYFATGRLGEFQRFHLTESGQYFTAWALHYAPFFFVNRVLYMHHYFPSLYFSILLTASLLSGLAGFLPRPTRLAIFLTLFILTISTFIRLAPLSYGSEMTREKCEAVGRLVNPRKASEEGVNRNELDCSMAPLTNERPKLLSIMKEQAKAERALSKRQQQETKSVDGKGSQPTENAAAPAVTTSAAPGPANNFMTAEPILDSSPSASFASAAANPLTPSVNLKSHRLSVTKPQPKLRAPILPMHLPPLNRRLPVSDIILLPYQQPPQHWDQDAKTHMMRREDLNLYEKLQIQQLVSGEYQKLNNDQGDEGSSNGEDGKGGSGAQEGKDGGVQDQGNDQKQELNGSVEKQQPQQHQDVTNDNTQRPSTEQRLASPSPPTREQLDAEIDEVLSRFQERNRQAAAAHPNHQIRLPQEHLLVEDDEAEMDEQAIDRLKRQPPPPASHENAGNMAEGGVEGGSGTGGEGGGAEGRNNTVQPRQDKHHTMGFAQPLKFEAGKSYKRRQKMMDAAVAAAASKQAAIDSQDQEQGDGEQGGAAKGFFNAAANDLRAKLFPSSSSSSSSSSSPSSSRKKTSAQLAEFKKAEAFRLERIRVAREDRIQKRLQSRREAQFNCKGPGEPALRALSPADMLRQVEEEDDAAVAMGIYDEYGEEVRGENGRNKDYMHRLYLDLVAQNELRKKIPTEERAKIRKEREEWMERRRIEKEERDRRLGERMRIRKIAKAEAKAAAAAAAAAETGEDMEEVEKEGEEADAENQGRSTTEAQEQEQDEYQLLQQQQDDANYGSDDYYDDYEWSDREEEQRELEMRGPPISVGSAEELEQVLKQLQKEGVRVEVVRGAVTETIEAPAASPVGALAGDAADYEGGEYYEGGEDVYEEEEEGGREVEEEEEEEEEEQLSPPIAVKNAEELASVLEKLAADGVRAEVVRGDLTRYVEPPMASV
ncbi:hypothetical protein BGZ96_010707 [Linnemannia gamsii]|uniref:dolichyl-phosphate-mannose--protein mannosyltransferase n=1 Tax=Linnemannia gamsii TaxID=64522 RepID=A0ABQ7JTY7_9FUNG|nr:hypothetical protein BGZ96_010707 [Linnemannia gamsii]